MKKNGKKWRRLQKEKEVCRKNFDMLDVTQEPQEYVCTHFYGIPFNRYRKLERKTPKLFFIETPVAYTVNNFKVKTEDWCDGSALRSIIRKISSNQGHCGQCKTKFDFDEIEKMDKLIQYLKHPDWNGEEADKLAIGIEPVRYIKDGKRITYVEKLYHYYKSYHEKNSPNTSEDI